MVHDDSGAGNGVRSRSRGHATRDGAGLHLVFELGRLELPFSEVQRLAPGVTLPLAVPVAGEVDILGNGRRIGRGTMVRIGESIGVRIVRLAGHG